MFFKKVSAIALVGIAIVLATATSGHAMGHGGGFAGHGPGGHFEGHGGFQSRHAFDGHHFDGHHFDGRFDHRFDHRFSGGVVIAPSWPYYYPYAPDPGYTYQAPVPSYWYYCPSYGSYYPTVQSCPEAWVPIPG